MLFAQRNAERWEALVNSLQDVLDELERRGQASHVNNPDYSMGLAEAHALLEPVALELKTKLKELNDEIAVLKQLLTPKPQKD